MSDLPPFPQQVRRLTDLGVLEQARLAPAELLRQLHRVPEPGLLVVDPGLVPPSALAPLLERVGRPGFVVVDMDDVDAFVPVEGACPPPGQVYVVRGLDRGDAMLSWSPDEAAPAIAAAGRTPLTLVEGLHWLLQAPAVLEPGRCFMTVGSRLRKADGRLDARTPALWISGGTGRDGRQRRGAPKVGWCWAGNRHTWLGFASAASRSAVPERALADVR